ncbi:nucleotide exchange factor SIL1 [Diabrotica undecimpunctata]|uniref:nucleotide exchange factor SIL1 n=1 Tax=Diabrotica undecimpunctata TaxID=50387 RepID=UPI003B631F38
MKYDRCIFIVFLILFEVTCNKKDNNGDEFIATEEWQTIKEGQKVPSGLHYRINVQTGLKEAKLIGKDDDHENKKTSVLEVPSEKPQDHPTIDELKEVMKKIKNDDVKPGGKLKSDFRTYEQLKEELGSLNLTSKVDAEILKDLFKQHQKEITKEKINVRAVLNILEDFDYLGHQFDTGLEFVRQNGFRDVIYKNLNSTNEQIKQNTLKLFGYLVQNNARVQIHALETGSIPILLRFLSSDQSELIKSNAVFALSCLVRRFPLAQKRFLENGGVFVILQIFKKDSIKLQLKVVTVMTDLFLEKRQSLDSSNSLVLNQYSNIDLENELLNQDWCLNLNTLLVNIVSSYHNDHDSVEKCLIAMELVSGKCKKFNRNILAKLIDTYQQLHQTEGSEDEYFKYLMTLCSNILKNLRDKSEL